ncbi:MAG: hypothetical protein PF503_06260 [Desulfobacula sp.]|jgi:hypothetical protein|nr:hypothetical protein [Desulfobacula sp.]
MTYCVDTDLLTYRSNILSLGVDSWEIQREQAYSVINRMLVARWYNQAAKTQGLDPYLTFFVPDQVEEGFLTRLESFKTLEFAYMILMKDSPEADGFERNMNLFARQFGIEFDSVIGMGVSYDWDASGSVDSDEVRIRAPRTLLRM